MSDDVLSPDDAPTGPRELSRPQRRVLGVLIEKAFTTPDQYPLTLKAATSGCNQKSNRDPVVNYSEEQLQRFLDELRAQGLVAVVHTESGRTERFRHYARKAYPFTEPQLAIMGELLLRGRQQPGELRTRASRMVPIDSQEQLRAELGSLLDRGYIQANGPLDRRGVEVDHNFYQADEARTLAPGSFTTSEPPNEMVEERSRPAPASTPAAGVDLSPLEDRITALEATVSELSESLHALRRELGVH
ncbi:hypothetical protein Pan44_13580 [Caulifigura coniformis]|uniref:Uncharacterized protein n=1 Tax=Caulifigura coniformis TaxID=2527983 RepID=A0A517SB25_9PLAN|nr:DUF480 domain-containing protein [Caulifigura coniformis]QDT53341.1 hypothetical protein Pan44_13580 [Caulifigura coniformis]